MHIVRAGEEQIVLTEERERETGIKYYTTSIYI